MFNGAAAAALILMFPVAVHVDSWTESELNELELWNSYRTNGMNCVYHEKFEIFVSIGTKWSRWIKKLNGVFSFALFWGGLNHINRKLSHFSFSKNTTDVSVKPTKNLETNRPLETHTERQRTRESIPHETYCAAFSLDWPKFDGTNWNQTVLNHTALQRPR